MTIGFFLITFAATWTCWYLAATVPGAATPASAPSALFVALFHLGVFTPGFVALGMTLSSTGAPGARRLAGALFRWRVDLRWYVFAIGFLISAKLTAAVVYRIAFGEWPAFGDTPVALMLAATLTSLLLLGQAGEELGWRGFALPRLAARLGLGWASVVLGVLWAAWHLPLFFLFPSADTYGRSFLFYLTQVVALSVVFAWLWWRTDGSLLLTMLLHAAVNNTKDIVPAGGGAAAGVWTWSASPQSWITVGVLWLFAAACLFDMRAARPPASTS